jgi:hypothetical protein
MTDAERIAQLEATVAALRRRLSALVEVLPVELLPLLEQDPPAEVAPASPYDLFAGWEDAPRPRPSTMAAELERLWRRV